jgi:hypothetical protein
MRTFSYLTQLGEGFANGLELPFVMVLTFRGLVCCKLYTKDLSKPNFPFKKIEAIKICQ